jgi:dolichol-phosphate mannosyltransferase
MKTISVIAPCFNEKENIRELYERVKKVFASLGVYDFELLYVDNDSTDGSSLVFRALAKKDKRVKVLFMSRNFGSPQPSFLAGMEEATGAATVLLHGDIQDPPELIPEFLSHWEKGAMVVYGVRKRREGYGYIWNALYKGFYYLLKKIAYIDIPINAGEFSLLDRRVVAELLNIAEYDYYLRCLRAFVGFPQVGVPYIRDARRHGKSTESFMTGLYWAKTIIVNFSFKPLEWISRFAFLVVVLTASIFFYDIYIFLFHRNAPSGVPTIVLLVLFLGGVQLLSLSVIAEYLSKIFLEVKRRPKYIVRERLN